MLRFEMKHSKAHPSMLGFLPSFLSLDDPRPAREQFDTAYAHGGGWSPFPGHKMLANGDLKYPSDEPTRLIAEAKLRDETIRIYEHAWVAIIQPNGEFEVARMD